MKSKKRLVKAMKRLEKQYDKVSPDRVLARARLEKKALSLQTRIEKS